MDKEKEKQLVNQILNNYDFLLSEDDHHLFGDTGTPSFHLLIKNKATPDGDFKQISHGKGICVLTVDEKLVEFVFDNLYDLMIPYIGDDAFIQKWQLKKKAKDEIAEKGHKLLLKNDIQILEAVIQGSEKDILGVLQDHNRTAFIEQLKKESQIEKILGMSANDEYLYIFNEKSGIHSHMTYIILSTREKSRENLDLIIYDYYKYLDTLIEENEDRYGESTTQSSPTPFSDMDQLPGFNPG
ncbi:MAG: hypothetical protein IEMM0008_0356 [bacterium]|nr:MAG: hypothetical protein IEMM0008_0356 [bacterium]